MRFHYVLPLIVCAWAGLVSAAPEAVETLEVGRVCAEFPVGFALLTAGGRQFVAYYDDQRRMTVAWRALDTTTWQYQVLPEKVGWDSHNSITMAADPDGTLHLAGNMHASKLVYFRTATPWDPATFARATPMVGPNETRCTYPQFLRGPAGELVFHYRDGGSGNGNEIFNVYDPKSRTWRRLLDQPITDGRGEMSAYLFGPVAGPDGFFHLCWVWRDTPDCATNHDPSYARSRDLVRWKTIDGRPLTLPITPKTEGVVVDPVPAGGGIINGAQKVGFDSKKRVLVSYHKFDAGGKTQAYVARHENGAWVTRPVSAWDYRWAFSGNGSIIGEISIRAVEVRSNGRLALPYSHKTAGSGELILDEDTLAPLGVEKAAPRHPAALGRPEDPFPGLGVKWAEDLGGAGAAGERYVLRWETLPANRDRPREGPLPAPTRLRVIKIRL